MIVCRKNITIVLLSKVASLSCTSNYTSVKNLHVKTSYDGLTSLRFEFLQDCSKWSLNRPKRIPRPKPNMNKVQVGLHTYHSVVHTFLFPEIGGIPHHLERNELCAFSLDIFS